MWISVSSKKYPVDVFTQAVPDELARQGQIFAQYFIAAIGASSGMWLA